VNRGLPLIQTGLLGEALEDGPVAIFVADEHMRYIAVNAYACDLLGYTRDELLELTVADVARPGAEQDFADVVGGANGPGSYELVRRDGTTFTFRYVASGTTVAGMQMFVAVGCPVDEPQLAP
jgi:PAS domain S-box-containing protein